MLGLREASEVGRKTEPDKGKGHQTFTPSPVRRGSGCSLRKAITVSFNLPRPLDLHKGKRYVGLAIVRVAVDTAVGCFQVVNELGAFNCQAQLQLLPREAVTSMFPKLLPSHKTSNTKPTSPSSHRAEIPGDVVEGCSPLLIMTFFSPGSSYPFIYSSSCFSILRCYYHCFSPFHS
ncbi:hypothetical protein P7K49_027120 [Saguinus oedipus]|uniref:Uncharacterized protein n=1 Tax=Saguinus oedipus TaxID=9490 RepID=A0ABQ9UF30_SAGOE|nr:hypothetical protein P7K49_027120 [Saguinus oedipus]